MFRSHEMSKLNQELGEDDNYEFKGATLKISNDETSEIVSIRNRGKNSSKNDEKSAILSGSDSTSPLPYESENTNYNCIGKEEYADDKFNIGYPPEHKQNQSETNGGNADEYFSFRSGQFEKAVNDCIHLLLRPNNDINILGSWLLTDVSHWDHERERIFILTSKTFVTIKYDFIALKILQNNQIKLNQIDTVLKGKLTYPQASLVPRIEGITNGFASIICGNLFSSRSSKQKSSGTPITVPQPQKSKLTVSQRFDFSKFRPVDRKDLGIRILWNRGQPLPILSSWNPFSVDIPWLTIKDHPIYGCQDAKASLAAREELEKIRHNYSAESLYNALIAIFSTSNPDSVNFNCCFEDGPILMENYVGIGAVIHNKNNFGFFKCRGKFSF